MGTEPTPLKPQDEKTPGQAEGDEQTVEESLRHQESKRDAKPAAV